MSSKSVDRLIRFQNKRLDENRLMVAQITERIERLNEEINQLNNRLDEEQELATQTIEGSMMFPNFAKGVNLRRKKVERYLREVYIQLEQEQEKMQEKFTELKRYEIIKDIIDTRTKNELEKKEQDMQDDLNMVRFHYEKNKT